MARLTSEEQWRAVPGYEGLYEASDLGNARSVGRYRYGVIERRFRPRPLRPFWMQRYLTLQLSSRTRVRTWRLHVMVLSAFVGPRPEGKEGAHLDGNKSNNGIANLAWVTPRENAQHRDRHGTTARGERHGSAVLCAADVAFIRDRAGMSPTIVAAVFGVNPMTISDILARRTWRHV